MKFSMTGQEKSVLLIQVTAWACFTVYEIRLKLASKFNQSISMIRSLRFVRKVVHDVMVDRFIYDCAVIEFNFLKYKCSIV